MSNSRWYSGSEMSQMKAMNYKMHKANVIITNHKAIDIQRPKEKSYSRNSTSAIYTVWTITKQTILDLEYWRA